MICPRCKNVVKEEATERENEQLRKIGSYDYIHECGAYIDAKFEVL